MLDRLRWENRAGGASELFLMGAGRLVEATGDAYWGGGF